jgi:hypothetical protein
MLLSVASKSGVKSMIKPPPPPATLVLDAHTFDEVALVGLVDTAESFSIQTNPRMKQKMFSSRSQHLGADIARP